MTQIRLVLVDDHDLVLRTLTALMQAEPDFEVVGTATTIGEALRVTVEARPDVVVMDYRLPDGNGAAGTRQIRRAVPSAKVVMLTGRNDLATRTEALEAGCSGFVTKGAKVGELADVIRAAAVAPDGPGD